MSMSAVTRHDAGAPPVVLDLQQAVLLESLCAAEGEPMSYGELKEAGIELPAGTVAELELAGVQFERCFLGEARGVGVRLERPSDARSIPPHTADEASSLAASPVGGGPPLNRPMGVIGRVVDYWRAGLTALVAWAVRNGPLATRRAVRWMSSAGRAAGERAHINAERALSGTRKALSIGMHGARDATLAVVAWLARVGPPAMEAVAKRSSSLAESGRDVAKRLLRHSIAELSVAHHALSGNLSVNSLHADGAPYPLGPPPDPTASASPWVSHQTRNRCLAFSALVAVTVVMFVMFLSNLGASAGGTQRSGAHGHNSRLAQPKSARQARAAQTSDIAK